MAKTDAIQAKIDALKAPPPIAPLAQLKHAGGKAKGKGQKPPAAPAAKKPKLSAEDAKAGIATAMQGLEGTASANAVAPSAQPAGESSSDPLFQSAVDLIVREQKANVRLLKTELKVGTTKALNLMDMLQQAGKVSACDERGARQVLVAA